MALQRFGKPFQLVQGAARDCCGQAPGSPSSAIARSKLSSASENRLNRANALPRLTCAMASPGIQRDRAVVTCQRFLQPAQHAQGRAAIVEISRPLGLQSQGQVIAGQRFGEPSRLQQHIAQIAMRNKAFADRCRSHAGSGRRHAPSAPSGPSAAQADAARRRFPGSDVATGDRPLPPREACPAGAGEGPFQHKPPGLDGSGSRQPAVISAFFRSRYSSAPACLHQSSRSLRPSPACSSAEPAGKLLDCRRNARMSAVSDELSVAGREQRHRRLNFLKQFRQRGAGPVGNEAARERRRLAIALQYRPMTHHAHLAVFGGAAFRLCRAYKRHPRRRKSGTEPARSSRQPQQAPGLQASSVWALASGLSAKHHQAGLVGMRA